MYDVIIIGAGVSGAAAARELSGIREGSASLKKKRMCAAAPPRPTAPSSTRGMTLRRAP